MSSADQSDKTVYLGLSGGVDSAVAAALLLEQGYKVHGVFLKIWSDKDEKTGQCPWVQDRRDAIAVAAKLGISLETVDFEKEYKEEVFSYFVKEYKAGRTPNPDILCNEVIKFGSFLEWALKQGADYIATGHHVRRDPESGKEERTGYKLLSGLDPEKDQSYFLARLNQHQLRRSLFPIGNFTKDQVRKKASELGLDTVADKRSTRGICFIGKVDLKDFLSKYTVEKQGDIIDQTGQVVGQHEGVSFYTIGQRKGLKIPAVESSTKPFFVIEKKPEENQLVVSNDPSALLEDAVYCQELHWLDGKIRKLPLTCRARIRYHQPLHEVTLSFSADNQLVVQFKDPIKGVAPGQYAVFYDGEELIGSAIIS